jgi:DNA-binding NarL/FixJ family response regulator
MKKICNLCGKKFEAIPKQKRYCSVQCSHQAAGKAQNERMTRYYLENNATIRENARRKYYIKKNIPIPPTAHRKGEPTERQRAFFALFDKQQSCSEIAKQLDVSRQAVSAMRKIWKLQEGQPHEN